jgi:hypothetical protein
LEGLAQGGGILHPAGLELVALFEVAEEEAGGVVGGFDQQSAQRTFCGWRLIV